MHEKTLTTLHTKNSITEQHLKEIRDALDHHTDMLQKICPQPVAKTEELARATPSDTMIPSMSDNVVNGTIEDDLHSQITCVARSIIDAISTRGSLVGQTSPGCSNYSQSNCEDDEVRSEIDPGTEGRPSTDSAGVRLSGFEVGTASRYPPNIPPPPLLDHRGNHSHNSQAATHTSSTTPLCFDAELMNDLLDRYVSKAHEDLCAGQFEDARDNLVRAIKQGKELEDAYKCPFEAEPDLNISLAKAYLGLGQFDLAQRTIQPLLTIARPPKEGELCYTRALIHLERYRKTKDRTMLDGLISLAQHSYKVAQQSNNISKPFLTESAKVLAESYKLNGDLVAAGTIRNRHPSIVSKPVCPGVGEPAFERQLSLSGGMSMEINSSFGAPRLSDHSLGLMPIRCSTEQRSQAESSSTPPTSAGLVSHDLDAISILLFQASQQGDVAMTKKYLNKGANIEHTDDDNGYTPLLVAAKFKHSGNLYKIQGKLSDAEKMYQRALDGYEKALGSEHTSTLGTINNLGNLYKDQGKLTEAEKMYRRVLDGYDKALNTNYIFSRRTAGSAITSTDGVQSGEAMLAQPRLLERNPGIKGPQHREYAIAMDNLAITLCSQEQYDEAVIWQRRLLEDKRYLFGDDHFDTMKALGELAVSNCKRVSAHPSSIILGGTQRTVSEGTSGKPQPFNQRNYTVATSKGIREELAKEFRQIPNSRKQLYDFRLVWDATNFRIQKCQQVQSFGEVLVLTGDGYNVEATTCASYVHAHWPYWGNTLLDALDRLFAEEKRYELCECQLLHTRWS